MDVKHVPHISEKTQIEDGWDQGTEENDWLKQQRAGDNHVMRRFIIWSTVLTKYH
jgi:hypothetical protein